MLNSRCYYLLVQLVVLLGLVALWAKPAGAQSTSEVNWVDGADQYNVAAAAVGGDCDDLRASNGSVKLALATGENWPDALAASALDRPLLLTGGASLHPATRRFVDGCSGSVHVIIIGGTAAVSQQVQTELAALGATVQRIAGKNRYETARKIAEFAVGSKVDLVYLATGANFADAIAAAPRVTVSSPIVLTPKTALGADAKQFLEAQLTSGGRVIVLGGTAAVSKAAQDAVEALGLHTRRIAGNDRYATSALTAQESLNDPNCAAIENIAVASGQDPYGGLAAASVRGPCQPLLLAPPSGTSVPSSLSDFLQTWSANLGTSASASCGVSMVGSKSTLGADILTQNARALTTAGCTPPTSTPTGDDAEQTNDDAEQFRNDYITLDLTTVSNPDRALTRGYEWWQRPRGELTVNVHICVGKGLEHLFTPRDLAAIANSYDRNIAPFYSWQSSGLLRVTFEPGDIIVSKGLTPGTKVGAGGIFAPADCLAPYGFPSDAFQGRTGHAFVVYGEGLILGCAGQGYLGGPFSTTYVLHDPTKSEPWRDLIADSDFHHGYPHTAQHEVDHMIGAPHHNDLRSGRIRVWTHPSARGHVGSLQGYPEIGRLRDDNGTGQTNYSVFPCYVLSQQGWPMGEDHPACSRIPPPHPQDIRLGKNADGNVELTWTKPSTYVNPEPVTGYKITLGKWSNEGGRVFSSSIVDAYRVGADSTSFILPKQDPDWTVYFATVEADSALGTKAEFFGIGSPSYFEPYSPEAFDFVFFGDGSVTVRHLQTSNGSVFIELAWPAVAGATGYGMTGIENCKDQEEDDGATYTCLRGFAEPRTVLSESLGALVVGKSYDIKILACNDSAEVAPSRYGGGCFVYAVVTVDLTNSTKVIAPQDPDTVVKLTLKGRPFSNWDRTEYAAEWVPHSTSSAYTAVVSWCEDDSPSWCGVNGNSGSYSVYYQGDDLEISATKVTTTLLLVDGRHYWVDVHVCGPADNQQQPRTCPVLASGEVTVPR